MTTNQQDKTEVNWEAVAAEAMGTSAIPDTFDDLSLEDQRSVVDRVQSSVRASKTLVESNRRPTDEAHVARLTKPLQKLEQLLTDLEERRDRRIG